MSKTRGNWSTNLGFVLATAGAAIGLGNLWKFPYLAEKNGGGAFVIVYLGLVLVLGFSLMLGEMVIGRRGKSDAFGSYNSIKKGWGFIGSIGVLCALVIYSYYVVIAGWIIKYIQIFITGGFSKNANTEEVFTTFNSSITSPIIYILAIIVITAFIVLKGISGGIEKASKIMMPLLLIFMIITVIRSVTLPGATKGIAYFLKPDFSAITPSVVIAALGQVFFSLSLGLGAIVTYGSYLSNDTNLVRSSVYIPLLDTAIALLAGLAILPAVYSFGLDSSVGPGLLFVTLPKIFTSMPGGTVFGTIFFILVLFAALTSTMSMLEVVVSFVVDQLKYSRLKAVIIISCIITVLSIPNSLSFGIMKETKFFDKNFFDLMGFFSDNLLLPIGGLLLCIFISFVWDKNDIKDEVTNGGTIPFKLFEIWIFGVKYIGIQILTLILLQSLKVKGLPLYILLIATLVCQIYIDVYQKKSKNGILVK